MNQLTNKMGYLPMNFSRNYANGRVVLFYIILTSVVFFAETFLVKKQWQLNTSEELFSSTFCWSLNQNGSQICSIDNSDIALLILESLVVNRSSSMGNNKLVIFFKQSYIFYYKNKYMFLLKKPRQYHIISSTDRNSNTIAVLNRRKKEDFYVKWSSPMGTNSKRVKVIR